MFYNPEEVSMLRVSASLLDSTNVNITLNGTGSRTSFLLVEKAYLLCSVQILIEQHLPR